LLKETTFESKYPIAEEACGLYNNAL